MTSPPEPRRPTSSARPSARKRARRVALRTFRTLPIPVRLALVRAGTPSHIVGAVCAVVCDGDVLALRQSHRAGWSLPGGLLSRGETAETCVRRELREEIGLPVEVGLPVATVVAAPQRRIDVVFRIDVPERFEVRVGGEANRAEWVPLAGLVEVDEPTAEILAVLARAAAPGAYAGRVLDR